MNVRWLSAAEQDLREIARYVALTFGRETAKHMVADIVKETQQLSDFPELGLLCHEYDNPRHKYRALITKHDKIVYTIMGNTIIIVAIFDSRRSPDSLSDLLKDRDSYPDRMDIVSE